MQEPYTTAYLSLGSNLGDRAWFLGEAARRLAAHPGLRLVKLSPIYETDAVADEPQPRYLNQVVRIETVLAARDLLDVCLAVERALGRVRPHGQRNAPRTVDIDLLLAGDLAIDEPGLRVPHPRLLERPFIRIPLAGVAEPGLRHPQTREPLDRADPAQGVRLF